MASLERAAQTTLYLVQQLKNSTAEMSALTSVQHGRPHHQPVLSASAVGTGGVTTSLAALPSMRTPLPDDTERAQFLMKLSPRIRRLESDTVRCLTATLESVLERMKSRSAEESAAVPHGAVTSDRLLGERFDGTTLAEAEGQELIMVGHCLRGLSLLGRGREAESTFARVAIMPLIRTKVSMGRLDEGGSRGECAGLFSLLDDMACSISATFGSVLRLSESMFDMSLDGTDLISKANVEVDLVTAGVWTPIATALMADPAVKMAIFSPGIASILQANYMSLDTFISKLAGSLLRFSAHDAKPESQIKRSEEFTSLYYQPILSGHAIRAAQSRIYCHPMTADFGKRWNLPIYFQLRFGDCCTKLNSAISRVQIEGWEADVFSGNESVAVHMRETHGLELPLFLEIYDNLLWLWRPDVVIRPLTHRFLRGALQLVGRILAFIKDGLEGEIKFGLVSVDSPSHDMVQNEPSDMNGISPTHGPMDTTYCWGDRVEDVAAVAWDLTVLETLMTHEYVDTIVAAVAPSDAADKATIHSTSNELEELREVVMDAVTESSQAIAPIVNRSWNHVIVGILTAQCSAPLSAVKGVAATYRMTNRPPPSLASPFVATILRPLQAFDSAFAMRTPPHVGSGWKTAIISAVSESYSIAVEELIATVERTEIALKSRKTRRAVSGGMSDGEKVKLQLYLDHKEFARQVKDAGIDGSIIPGLVKLGSVTSAAEGLFLQSRHNVR